MGYYRTTSCCEVGSGGSGDSKSMCVMLAEYEVGGKRIRLRDPSPLYVRGSDQQLDLDAAAQGDSGNQDTGCASLRDKTASERRPKRHMPAWRSMVDDFPSALISGSLM
ncbi:hypothetical protein CFAM422_002108 [Trichoderma lentiforme]|uniref:Uncharacterized protein n=1 Tax=Trichoderma lentiforme TaxID=1567552 RepID=A0A9P5CIJ9_9HYPO|nr:hypothetical protein CFAM422_002108 [Trichoderma lentiforme]